MPDLAYVIVYVPSVLDTLDFYTRAFGLERGFLHEEGDYGELVTGATRLAFTSHALAAHAVPGRYRSAEDGPHPLGMELTLTVDDVDAAFSHAVESGAKPMAEPHDAPWGQRVSYVVDNNNVLVGLVSAMPS